MKYFEKKLTAYFGEEIMAITDFSEKREKMLDFYLKEHNLLERTCNDAKKMLDMVTKKGLTNGQGSHIVACAILFASMMKNGNFDYESSYVTPFAIRHGCTPSAVSSFYELIKKELG